MKKIITNIFYLFLPIILGSIVGLIINNFIDYQNLTLPLFSPPKVFFPIAWSIIYLLMGLSYYIFKKKITYNTTYISKIYYLELLINLLWSIIFFVFKWRFISIILIILLDILVYILIKLFSTRVKLSSYLNYFYLGWILFATYLTIGIYILN